MRIVRLPDVVARLKPLGIQPIGNSSAEFAQILSSDIARWSEVATSRQYQDRAIASARRGEIRPTTTVATAATTTLRISAPSPT